MLYRSPRGLTSLLIAGLECRILDRQLTRDGFVEDGFSPEPPPNYNCSVASFSQGCTRGGGICTNCDHLLIVTSGSGTMAIKLEQHEINVGDLVHIKAGERHRAWRQSQYGGEAYHDHRRRQSSDTRIDCRAATINTTRSE